MKKQLYEQPTTKTLVVRFGGMICQSPGLKNSWAGPATTNSSWGYEGEEDHGME